MPWQARASNRGTCDDPSAMPPDPAAPVPFYRVDGAGTPVVLVHGVAGSHRIWDLVAPALVADHRVLRLDLLGYGRSPAPRTAYTPQVHTDAVRRAVQQAGIDQPVVLVGLSMGGTLVLEYARRWPGEVLGIVVVGLPYYRDPEAARRGLRQDPWVRQALEHRRAGRLWIPPLWHLATAVPGLAGVFSSIYTPAMARDALRVPYRVFCSSIDHVMVQYSVDAAVAATAGLPRLFMHGSEDRWAPAGEVADLVSGAAATTFETVEGKGHNLAVLDPEHLVDRVRTFCMRHAAGPGDAVG